MAEQYPRQRPISWRAVAGLRAAGLIATGIVAGLPAFVPAVAHGSPGGACFPEAAATTAATVSDLGDVELASGTRIHLADVSLPEANVWRRQALAEMRRFLARQVTAVHASQPDRWRRHRGTLQQDGSDLSERLVRQGLAVVDAGEAPALCNRRLLAIEQEARTRKAGLWSVAANRPVSARNHRGLLARSGRFTLVTGRIVSVGVREKRVYLNFGGDWKADFTASISPSVWAGMEKSGLTAERLKGKLVRVRGVIRQWNGPAIDISATDMLELIDPM